jgi:hypothetical protein
MSRTREDMRKQADTAFSTRLSKQRTYWGKCPSSYIVKKCPVSIADVT